LLGPELHLQTVVDRLVVLARLVDDPVPQAQLFRLAGLELHHRLPRLGGELLVLLPPLLGRDVERLEVLEL
jgi:hypothetical protein